MYLKKSNNARQADRQSFCINTRAEHLKGGLFCVFSPGLCAGSV